MIKQYCKNTIKWEQHTNTGYGDSYLDFIKVENVYIEENIKLNRGSDDTTSSNALVICYEDITFKKGDRITFPSNRKYIITTIETFNKQRSTQFDHIELILTEINNG